jgi:hypothetical protein
MYLHNKYTITYYNIIAQAQSRTLDCYTENHHIIPKSLGGSNDSDNLVALTAREHFLCHWLLTKMTEGRARISMAYAFMGMCHWINGNQERYKIPARTYEILKQRMAEVFTGRTYTAEAKKKMSKSAKNRCTPEWRKKQSKLSKEMMKQGKWGWAGQKRYKGKDNTFAKAETKEKIKQANIEKYGYENPALVPYKCEHCGSEGTGLAGYKRWHGAKCRTINT